MKSFLEKVVTATIELPPRKTLILFPTQRACQEYRKIIAATKKEADWLPAILPIRDLLLNLKAPLLADDLTLLLELYEVHRELFKEEEFEKFISYGQQLIDDFNEIDRQAINPDLLFEEINDLKSLEARFSPGEEDFEYIRSFWSEFIRTPLTPLQDQFLLYWKQLPVLYHEFRKRLESKNLSYEGMAWRKVAETMEEQDYFSKYTTVIFAGFYALNKTEEKVMEALRKQGKLMLLRDADTFYTDNRIHEAGMFFRKGMLADSSIPWLEDYFSIPKEVYSVKGCSGRFAIARELASSLHHRQQQRELSNQNESLVVVLADESLLFPLLHFCGRLGITTNPSMGFSLKHHPLIRLMHLIKTVRQFEDSSENSALKYKQLQEFCAEPLFKRMFSEEELGLNSKVYAAADVSNFHDYFRELLFKQPVDSREEQSNILALLDKFRFRDDEWIQQIHFQLVNAIQQVFTILELHEAEISLNVWWQLFLESVEMIRVPFSADKEMGIPIVGFLDTRLMDYSTVFIAPLNEDVLPSVSVSKSLIPYSLRKAYHLPCKEEQDAVTAYHFYRLLQRARNIYFFYNTDLNDTGGGERSRYLFQIHHEIIEKIKPVKLEYLQQESQLIPEPILPISIVKNDSIIGKLREKYILTDPTSPPKGISASALSSYIACSLRFYLDQLVYLRPEDKTEGLSAGHFGNVLHKAMELAYEGRSMLNTGDYPEITKRIPEIVESSIAKVYDKPVNYGHDYLMKGVLTELIHRIINFDMQHTPFEILGLELNANSVLQIEGVGDFMIKGIIDRIDFKDGNYRILDYKTGQDKIMKKWNFEKLFTDPSYKLNLQLLIYGMLAKEILDIQGNNLIAGIFKMKEFDEEITWLNDANEIEEETMQQFIDGLKNLLSQLFNPEIPFSQTSDLKRCRYCDYKGLCQRQNA
ncbi:MAG: PD-(D/E)XK nuclease family protein [Bacteroidetes bacterium]|nr:PD-(D/E)XK nuclease family protein [Bacteroidota bacterium]